MGRARWRHVRWGNSLNPKLDTNRLLTAALGAGVCIAPSSAFDASAANRRSIRINFTLNDEERLAEGVRRLAAALRSMDHAKS